MAHYEPAVLITKHLKSLEFNGGDEEDRTPDLRIANKIYAL
jgi:hypothetical protein